MRYLDVGNERVSLIGLGTSQFGSREWGYGSHYSEHDAVDIVDRALALGVNLIDTAELYGFGRSERIVGRAIAERRAEVFLATKVLPVLPVRAVIANRAAAQCPPSRRRPDRPLPARTSPTRLVPLTEQMAAMRTLQSKRCHPPDRGEQLHPRALAGTPKALSAGPSSRTRSVSASSTGARSSDMTDVGGRERPRRDRLQPTRPGPAVGPL